MPFPCKNNLFADGRTSGPAAEPTVSDERNGFAHMEQLVSIDFFVVPTITFKLLFVFVILSHERRRVIHFNVTMNPTAEWTAQQLVNAFPYDTAPRYLLRDRDKIYGDYFRKRIAAMETKEVLIAPRSPWQTPYVERLIGSIRLEAGIELVLRDGRRLRISKGVDEETLRAVLAAAES